MPNLDTFGVAFSVPATQAARMVTGPILAGVVATCAEGDGTYHLKPGLTNDGLRNSPGATAMATVSL